MEGDIGQVLKVVLAFETPLVTTAKMLGSLDMAVQSLQETQKKPFPAQPKVEHLTDKPNPTPQRSRSPPKSGSGSSSQSDALEKRLDRLEGGDGEGADDAGLRRENSLYSSPRPEQRRMRWAGRSTALSAVRPSCCRLPRIPPRDADSGCSRQAGEGSCPARYSSAGGGLSTRASFSRPQHLDHWLQPRGPPCSLIRLSDCDPLMILRPLAPAILESAGGLASSLSC